MQKYEKTADVLILSMFFSAKNNSCAKHEKLICCTKNEDGKNYNEYSDFNISIHFSKLSSQWAIDSPNVFLILDLFSTL